MSKMKFMWPAVLTLVEDQLLMVAQEVRGTMILPNKVRVRIPSAAFERWSPVLGQVTEELGESLVAWATLHGYAWYADNGPSVVVELKHVERTEVDVQYIGGGV